LGVAIADAIVQLIGAGAWQLGVMVVLAMGTAVALGGGEILVVEAAVSAILLIALSPAEASVFSPTRILEAVIGGGTALAVTSLLFPPDPALGPGRAAQAVFEALGRSLGRLSDALAHRDAGAAERAFADARSLDGLLRAVDEELATGRETARYAPPRRAARADLDRYARTMDQVDHAARDARVLARHVLRLARGGAEVPADVPAALRDLADAVWELAAAYDAPAHADEARGLAIRAAAAAAQGSGSRHDLAPIAGQVSAVAVDLVRAAELVTGDGEPEELATEELLIGVAPA
jgi:hypothetical protein